MLSTPYTPHPLGLLAWCILAALTIAVCLPSIYSRKPLIQLFFGAEWEPQDSVLTQVAATIKAFAAWCRNIWRPNGEGGVPFPPRPLADLVVRQYIAIRILPSGPQALGEVVLLYGKVLIAASTLYMAADTAVKISWGAEVELLGEVVHCEVRDQDRYGHRLTIRLRHVIPLTEHAKRQLYYAA